MNVGGLRVGRLTSAERNRLLARARAGAPTYDHVGSTLDPQRWNAAGVHAHSITAGRGPAAFTAARNALQTWAPQRAIGAEVIPPDQRVAPGATIVLVVHRGPVWVVVPNRVVTVIDEPRRYAFAYGTLPGHAERGEESFTVEHLEDDTVRATIRVQAVPATLAARATAPVVRQLQRAALRSYLAAIAAQVAVSEQSANEGSE